MTKAGLGWPYGKASRVKAAQNNGHNRTKGSEMTINAQKNRAIAKAKAATQTGSLAVGAWALLGVLSLLLLTARDLLLRSP